MAEQIVDLMEANMPSSSDAVAAARGAGGAAGEEAGRVAAASLAGDMRDRLAAVSSRLDVLVASGSDGGDVGTELRDVRVGADGTTYASAGQSVRSQIQLALRSKAGSVSSSNVAAPYDDMDTLPDMTVVTFQDDPAYMGVAHAEGLGKGTALTVSGLPYGLYPDGGKVQLFVSEDGRVSSRILWNNPPVWGGWRSAVYPEDGVALPYGKDVSGLPADMDDYPSQSIVTIPYGEGVAHAPDGFRSGTVATLSGLNSGDEREHGGLVQILVDKFGGLHVRTCWNNPAEWSDWRSYATDGDVDESEYASMTVFPRIGVIGDSYCSGEIYVDGSGGDYYQLSWGQCIARLCGVSCVNFSKGGLSTRTWLTDDKGLSLLKATEAQDLYLICLGINDDHRFGLDYLGSETDMHDDWADNPDTFHGNYARIIGEIRAHAPKAKIIPITVSNLNNVIHDEFNTAIENIAAHFGLPCLRADDDPFFASTLYQDMVGGHPTALVYSGMAKAYMRLFSKAAIRYKSYFDDYVGN